MDQISADVVVVGAGVSGLVAAERLARSGYDVVVLEGHERVGGRTLNGELGGTTVDLGAAFVGPAQHRVISMLDRFGLQLRPVYDKGRSISVINGRMGTYRGTIPKLRPLEMLDYGRVELAFRKVIKKTRVSAPWMSDDAESIDGISLGGWLARRRASTTTRKLFATISRVCYGVEPEEISLMQAARYFSGAGGLDKGLAVEGGSQQDVIVGGFGSIALALARELGGRVRTRQVVRRITTDADGTLVETDDMAVRCSFVIVATQANQRKDIAFRPQLPDNHRLLSQRWRQGALTKAIVAYPTAFWREDGLSGSVVNTDGPVFLVFDVGAQEGPGVLMSFVDTRKFDQLDETARRELVLSQLETMFGPRARVPLDYVDHRWAMEEFAAGAPFSIAPPFGLTQHGRSLREPVGVIHWAGTDTGDEYVGYVEGAIAGGERAADEVLERLSAAAVTAARAGG
ncbi:FAD-dependent oxidoreductase [Williamsia sp. CHRR-6]|uniref:flavin monoamine oxidase family protein n=1 Tax=Williamsia sp. CHRR-6 TaxID=2835871 RepID=UPI001BDA7920|nr:FAD-dependent oxidoreductase [Williamsia sp. CHRR-6]MBT0566935.1 FAD-dependent oxidoreductase [Williamsia sp. CHRR-6]